MLKIGTSAGGARAKALIAWNEETKDIRSGQIDAGDGYSYWLLKFGEIKNNKDKDKEADSPEYPKIEYAYSLMTKDAGIDMTFSYNPNSYWTGNSSCEGMAAVVHRGIDGFK